MTSTLDLRERTELCDRFLELGPDAPTLCEGWATKDLAAHLVVRERDPRSAPGILLGGRFEGYTERLMARQLAQHGYEGTVDRVRSGPPLGPMRIPPVRHAVNLLEFFVHHEDVRRANGEAARADLPDLDAELWTMLRRLLGMTVRRAKLPDVQLVLDAGEGRQATAGKGREVRLAAPVQEIVLYLQGRKGAADVAPEGDADAVAAVEAASFGI